MKAMGLALAAMLFMAQDAAPPEGLLDDMDLLLELDLSEHLEGLEREAAEEAR